MLSAVDADSWMLVVAVKDVEVESVAVEDSSTLLDTVCTAEFESVAVEVS